KTAKSIASLEGVERFASEFYAFDYKDEVKEGSYNEVTKSYSVLPFEELTLEENSKLDTDTNLYWIPGTSIRDG
ncbi:YcaO-like family protein, partial [Klebsiella pneumoniae]